MACITDYTTGGSSIIIVVVVLVAVGGISVSPERMEREGRSRLLNEFSRRRRRGRNLCSANWTPTSSPFQSGPERGQRMPKHYEAPSRMRPSFGCLRDRHCKGLIFIYCVDQGGVEGRTPHLIYD